MSTSETDIPTTHWADHAADHLVQTHPDKSPLICAAGISPSGTVHIGNFREVITVDFVVRALRDRKREVRFLFSWDDYDAFRKVPKNVPDPKGMESKLRLPISDVPDPYGKAPSFAAHNQKPVEEDLVRVGIFPEYVYQNRRYRDCAYQKGVRHALKHQPQIVKILNAARTQPLPDNWWCATVYCKKCGKDATKIESYEDPTLTYYCKICKASATLDLTQEPGAKLLWRVDWPMRWAKEGVDFEPCGKDHSSQGGSFETGSHIIREVWKTEPPYNFGYDFVLVKGLGAKISSSEGNVITLGQALEIYEPAVLRYLFASRKPNLDFSIAFDLDVMKAYDDFDRTQRIAFKREEAEDKKYFYEKRIYELSIPEGITPPSADSPQFAFRHLCNILQIHQGDLDQTLRYFEKELGTLRPQDAQAFRTRAQCAWNWITRYAPEEFRFQLRSQETAPAKTQFPEAIGQVVELLESAPQDEEALAQSIYQIMKGNGLKAKTFFPEIYSILIGKGSGPKLAPFILIIGADKVAGLLKQSL